MASLVPIGGCSVPNAASTPFANTRINVMTLIMMNVSRKQRVPTRWYTVSEMTEQYDYTDVPGPWKQHRPLLTSAQYKSGMAERAGQDAQPHPSIMTSTISQPHTIHTPSTLANSTMPANAGPAPEATVQSTEKGKTNMVSLHSQKS